MITVRRVEQNSPNIRERTFFKKDMRPVRIIPEARNMNGFAKHAFTNCSQFCIGMMKKTASFQIEALCAGSLTCHFVSFCLYPPDFSGN